MAKCPGRESDNSLSPIADVINEWDYIVISTTPYANMLWTNTNILYGAVQHLTLRLLMSYIYIYMEHPFLMFLDHTQRRTTVGRTPLDE